jgi:hypothetical protein
MIGGAFLSPVFWDAPCPPWAAAVLQKSLQVAQPISGTVAGVVGRLLLLEQVSGGT